MKTYIQTKTNRNRTVAIHPLRLKVEYDQQSSVDCLEKWQFWPQIKILDVLA